MEQLLEPMKSMQEEMRTSTKAYQERMESQISSLVSRMEAGRKSDREEIRASQEQMASLVSWIEANQAKMDVNLNEMRSILNAWIADMKDGQIERIACQGKTETWLEFEEPASVVMEPEAEHQEVPKEEAAVMPVGRLRRWLRDWNLAVERHQKPKETNRRSCESWKRLTVSSRRMTRCAGVAWLGRNVVRKYRTRKQVEQGTPKGAHKRMSLACESGLASLTREPGSDIFHHTSMSGLQTLLIHFSIQNEFIVASCSSGDNTTILNSAQFFPK
jgi:hypothetical protein